MPNLNILSVDAGTGLLKLGLATPSDEIEGIELLVQIVTILYLTDGGRSITFPDRVGGLRQFLGNNVNPDDPSELMADIRMMTTQIEQQIKQEQTSTGRPPSERLQALQLIDIIPNEADASIEIIVSVMNEEQQTEQAVVRAT